MKKIFLTAIAVLTIGFANAQRQGGFRVGFDYGLVASSGGGSIFTIEPKYNIKDNMNVGIKIGAVGLTKQANSNLIESVPYRNTLTFFTGTYNYYFNPPGKSFVPFVGAGISYNFYENVKNDYFNVNNSKINLDTDAKIGGCIMGGFEYKHSRISIEYNIIPESKLSLDNGQEFGTVSNTYLGINLGFYLGGGSWGR